MPGNNIIERLYASFTDLEEAIHSAKATLATKASVPPEVFVRLDSYDTILFKQRQLASELKVYINKGNWGDVSRHVNLINGLSAMIRDDARAILSSLSLNSDVARPEESVNYC